MVDNQAKIITSYNSESLFAGTAAENKCIFLSSLLKFKNIFSWGQCLLLPLTKLIFFCKNDGNRSLFRKYLMGSPFNLQGGGGGKLSNSRSARPNWFISKILQSSPPPWGLHCRPLSCLSLLHLNMLCVYCHYIWFNYFSTRNVLTLSSLNLPLSSSSTTSRELLSQFSTCSGWRWFDVW